MSKPMMIYNPQFTGFDNAGVPVSGGKLFIYLPGTVTKQNTYTDATLTTANPNPIILDSAGRTSNNGSPIDMYIPQAFKMVLSPSTDTDPPMNAIWTKDNVTTLGQLVTMYYHNANYSITTSDRDAFILADSSAGSITITLLPSALVGNGFRLIVKKYDNSANTVTIQASGSEVIDGANTYVLTKYNQTLDIVNDGATWAAVNPSITVLPVVSNHGTSYQVLPTDQNALIECNAANTALVMTLLSTSIAPSGFKLSFKKTDPTTNTVTITTATGSQTIDGNTSYILTNQYQAVTIVSNGVNWDIEDAYTGTHSSGVETLFTTVGTSTFVSPSNPVNAYVEVWGAGGGGGGNTTSAISAGGGGGGYAGGYVALTPNTSYTITVGAGGASIAANTLTNGNPGGSSSFSTTVVATGGAGGGSGGSASSSAGGTGTAGTFLLMGGNGGVGSSVISTGGSGIVGGTAPIIGAGNVVYVGLSGINYGNGGNGGNTTSASGAGANGLVRIKY